jgi:hypothetical protein
MVALRILVDKNKITQEPLSSDFKICCDLEYIKERYRDMKELFESVLNEIV